MPKVTRKPDENIENGSGAERRVLMQAVGWQIRMRPYAWSPATDIFESETAYTVKVEIAGMRQEDFSVIFEKGQLIVSGVRIDPSERRAFHQMEIRYGEFSTAVAIPGPIDADDAVAEYEDGFLTVILPKAIQPTSRNED